MMQRPFISRLMSEQEGRRWLARAQLERKTKQERELQRWRCHNRKRTLEEKLGRKDGKSKRLPFLNAIVKPTAVILIAIDTGNKF